ncbi:MAG: DNA-binding response regulator [Gammaproteobacteria bacterium]|nr:MAG: DNA-binding response regulator [Gammaproteobacteria bacterium]
MSDSASYKFTLATNNEEIENFCKDHLSEHQLVIYSTLTEIADNTIIDNPSCVIIDTTEFDDAGLETCKKLKEDEDTFKIPVVILTDADTIEDRLDCYLCGCDDVISTPFEGDEFKARVQVAAKNKQIIDDVQADANEIWETALEAMSTAGELGGLLVAIEKCILCNSYDELSNEIFAACEAYELNVSFQIRSTKGLFFYGNNLTPEKENMENELLSRAKDKSRFFDFGARTIVNFESISLLIKNMPLDDMEKYGRIKDNIAPFLSSADSRIRAIALQMEVEKQRSVLERLISDTQSAVEYIEKQYSEHKEQSGELLERLIQEMDAGFISLNLSEAEECHFRNLLENSKTQIMELYEGGLEIDNSFEKIMFKIRRTLKNGIS